MWLVVSSFDFENNEIQRHLKKITESAAAGCLGSELLLAVLNCHYIC